MIELISKVFWATSPLIGGVVSRMSGGMKPKLPRPVDQVLYAIPYVFLPFQLGFAWPFLILSAATAVFGKVTGHGQWMDLGTWLLKVTPERLDFIVKWVFGDDPNVVQTTPTQQGNYWRDFFGLVVVGSAVTWGLVISMLWYGLIWQAALVFVGGALKAVAYAAGWKFGGFKEVKELDEPTEIGEVLTGIFGWGSLALVKFLSP